MITDTYRLVHWAGPCGTPNALSPFEPGGESGRAPDIRGQGAGRKARAERASGTMALHTASQGPLWDKLALFGIRGKPQILGFNRHAGRTGRCYSLAADLARGEARKAVATAGSRVLAIEPPTAKRARAAKRRGFNARGELLPGWKLLPCGIATYDG